MLYILQGVLLLGSRLSGIAVGLWLVKAYGSVTPLLLIPLFQELPTLFLGVWAGLAVDRFNRKKLMIFADAGQAAGTLVLLFVVADGELPLAQLYTIVTLQGIFAAVQGPAISAFTYELASENELDKANGLKELMFPLAGVLAPFLAGMLYGPLGIRGIVLIDLAAFAAAAAGTFLLPVSTAVHKQGTKRAVDEPGFWKQGLQGFTCIFGRKGLLAFVVFMAWWNLMLNGPLELAIPHLLVRTGSDRITSLMLAAMNAGAMCGALLVLSGLTFRKRLTPMFVGSLVTAIMFVVFGLADRQWILAMSIFLLMIPLPMIGALYSTLVQIHVPAHLHGRVFAAIGQINALTAPLSFIITGPLVERWLEPGLQHQYGTGAGTAVVLTATGCLILIGSFATFFRKSVRTLEK